MYAVTLMLAWIRDHRKTLLIWAPFVVLVLWVAFCRPKPNPVPPKEQHTIDSLTITRPAFDSSQLRRAKAETVYVVKSTQEAHRGAISLASADSLRMTANALQARAEATGDTLSQWRGVAIARKLEADTLREALSATTHALDLQTLARFAADSSVTDERRRRVALEDLSARLATDVRTAGQCRILWIASCPSRKVVGIASLTAGAIGGVVIVIATRK